MVDKRMLKKYFRSRMILKIPCIPRLTKLNASITRKRINECKKQTPKTPTIHNYVHQILDTYRHSIVVLG